MTPENMWTSVFIDTIICLKIKKFIIENEQGFNVPNIKTDFLLMLRPYIIMYRLTVATANNISCC